MLLSKKIILIAFGLTGASSLVYEIAWLKSLAYFFGTTAFALSGVVSVFLLGLAFGSYIGGQHAGLLDKKVFSLLLFALGLYGFISLFLINNLQQFYILLSGGLYSALLLAFLVLIIPTIIIGAIFIIVLKLVSDFQTVGIDSGVAYSVELLGSAIGVLIASFILLPLYGISLTVAFAAGLNVISGILVYALVSDGAL